MTIKKTLAVLSSAALAAAFLASRARTAATSRSAPPATYAALFGGRFPIPEEYAASARRERDEPASPQSVLLYATGNPESSWARSGQLDDGSVLVEAIPFESHSSMLRRVQRVDGRVEGLAYPAFAYVRNGRVSVALVTPKRLVRFTSARWTTAFDQTLRGYRDDA